MINLVYSKSPQTYRSRFHLDGTRWVLVGLAYLPHLI